MTAPTRTERQATTTGMAATGVALARRIADESTARIRVLIENSMKPAAEAFSKASSGAVELGRGNLEAMAQSAQAYLAGMQDLSRRYLEAVQGLTQHTLEGARTFAGVKSLKDAMAIQASLTRGSIERALGEGAKLQQAALKVTEQVHAPLTQRATVALEQPKLARAA